ncbi:MAG: hypothetical protein JWR50_103 [Mucilaginibacter sp.]|nr:hypothetical protein [Mucilaginibacter sp.]
MINKDQTIAKAGLTLTLFLIGAGLSRTVLAAVGFRPLLQGIILWIAIFISRVICSDTFGLIIRSGACARLTYS